MRPFDSPLEMVGARGLALAHPVLRQRLPPLCVVQLLLHERRPKASIEGARQGAKARRKTCPFSVQMWAGKRRGRRQHKLSAEVRTAWMASAGSKRDCCVGRPCCFAGAEHCGHADCATGRNRWNGLAGGVPFLPAEPGSRPLHSRGGARQQLQQTAWSTCSRTHGAQRTAWHATHGIAAMACTAPCSSCDAIAWKHSWGAHAP